MLCGVEKDTLIDEEKNIHPKKFNQSSILKICNERNDEVVARVLYRMDVVLGDLHDKDTKYHLDCYQRFNSSNAVGRISLECKKGSDDDLLLDSLVTI